MSEQTQTAPEVSADNVNSAQEPQTNQESVSEAAQEQAPATEGELKAAEAAIDQDKSMTKAEKVEAKKMLKKLQIKFNGKVLDEELPFEIPDTPEARKYMQDALQLRNMAQYNARERAELEKEVGQLVEQLRKNPKAVLADKSIGIDLKKLAAEIIQEEIENSKKSPEQLRAEKAEEELKRIKDEREREKQELRNKELERIKEQAYQNYEIQVSQALEKTQLPHNPYIVKKMADYMIEGVKNNIEITPFEAANLVKEEMHEELKQMFSVMPEDVIEAIVGKDTIKRMRKKDLAKAKANIPPTPVSKQVKDVGNTKQEATENNSEKKKTFKDFFGV